MSSSATKTPTLASSWTCNSTFSCQLRRCRCHWRCDEPTVRRRLASLKRTTTWNHCSRINWKYQISLMARRATSWQRLSAVQFSTCASRPSPFHCQLDPTSSRTSPCRVRYSLSFSTTTTWSTLWRPRIIQRRWCHRNGMFLAETFEGRSDKLVDERLKLSWIIVMMTELRYCFFFSGKQKTGKKVCQTKENCCFPEIIFWAIISPLWMLKLFLHERDESSTCHRFIAVATSLAQVRS